VGAKFMPAATEARKAASGLKGKKKGGKKWDARKRKSLDLFWGNNLVFSWYTAYQ
jgi:hypothetical protein